jgi:hypothetical protein
MILLKQWYMFPPTPQVLEYKYSGPAAAMVNDSIRSSKFYVGKTLRKKANVLTQASSAA